MQNVTTNFSYAADDKRIGIISISGMVDLSNVGNFSQFLDKVLEVACETLIFNLEGLTYMNSTGFGALTSRAMNEPKFKIIFCNLETNISEVFSMFGLDNICDILPDLDSSIEVAKTLCDQPGDSLNKEELLQNTKEEITSQRPTPKLPEKEASSSKPSSPATEDVKNQEDSDALFPMIERCLSCEKKINFRTTGHYRCPRCKSILFVNELGTLALIENPLSPSLPAVPESEGPDEIIISFPSDTNYLSKIRDFIMSFTKSIFNDLEQTNVTMAVDEACSNAIEHAHHFDRNKKIQMSVLINTEKFVITVTDSGENTFNEHLEQADDQIKKSGRGMGIILMKRMMDEVNIRKTKSNGTSITLTKYRKDNM